MATEEQFARVESLPPAFLQQFFAGVPGANIPGVHASTQSRISK